MMLKQYIESKNGYNLVHLAMVNAVKDVVKPLLLEQGSTRLLRNDPVRTVNNAKLRMSRLLCKA